MLEEAGLEFSVIPSPFDEDACKQEIRCLQPSLQAAYLADGKAKAVSTLHPDAYVIGADQICSLDQHILDKPGTVERATTHLQRLQGRKHHQYSAACIYHRQALRWLQVEVVTLTMHPLSETEIADYIRQDQPLHACGAYCYEKQGHTLFSQVEGDVAAIKGLPLHGLLAFLKQNGIES